jgi:UDP-N-acetylmuramoyl-tripeptide--D-alanyl-D-alanine ligase
MFSIGFLTSVLGVSKKGSGTENINTFSIDSNQILPQDCFIGLLGQKVDGGSFFKAVLEKGARGLILNKIYEIDYLNIADQYPNSWAFFVDDTAKSLFQLAKKWRSLFNIPIIAITGSVGKTTTKELIKTILEKEGHTVCATLQSQNGKTGMPLTLLRLRPEHTIAVIEVGISQLGEMDILVDILQSVFYTIITTILPAHILYLKSIENIILEKKKLQYITLNTLFIDYKFKKQVNHKQVITFGDDEQAYFCYHSMSTQLRIEINELEKKYVIYGLCHQGLHHCITAAFAVCYFLQINPLSIIKAIESFERVEGRFSVHHLSKGGIIINDCYNAAHPTVMIKSIDAFECFPTNKKKIIVLADMFEQGECTEQVHDSVVERVNALSNEHIEKVFYVGAAFKQSAEKNNKKQNMIVADSFVEVADEIYSYLDKQYCILFKGSNGTKLFYHISNYLKNETK